jgi:hypothetical protein
MSVYLFWSWSDVRVFGLTSCPDGGNLPTEFAPWAKDAASEPLYTGPSEALTGSNASNSVIVAIQQNGFYLGQISRPAHSVSQSGNHSLH